MLNKDTLKSKKIFSTITNILFSLILIVFILGSSYLIVIISKTPELKITEVDKKISSKIFDVNDNYIKQLDMEDYGNVKYEELPDVFINALLSCEDVRFFMHNGIDLPRILSALKNDIVSASLKEGASTITQQLIKNMMLTSSKTIERKIQEIYLANKIEKLYSKKQILEFYCNFVCFDGVNHGVQSASYKYFNKSISYVTLPEAAVLVGVVNAPSAYSPLINPKLCNDRKNTVLKMMEKHGFIDNFTLNKAMSIEVSDMLNTKQSTNSNEYSYQGYIDVAYKQIYDKTGYDPYVTPMEIYTYMDSALQKQIDDLSVEQLKINNKYQDLAATIINNYNGSISAIFPSKEYKGKRLFNKAYDKKIQPASTIKIILDYALAFEYLSFSSKQTLLDVPTNYPYSTTPINNVDNIYMGEITIDKAIGYSRNTTAISTLEKVVNKIGIDAVIDYLNDINMMDEGKFSYSYGLGGYTYGVSVTDLAAAYSLIARKGEYIEPLAVRKIKLLDGSNTEIDFSSKKKKVLSEEACYLLINVLNQVMESNYWSIQDCKPNNVNVYAKTGTTSFDKQMANNYNIPNGASKDRWLASFTKDYTIACWTGFDKYIKDEKTYFTKNSIDANVVKRFTKLIYDRIAKRNQVFEKPDGIVKVKIVKGSDLLASDIVDEDYVVTSLYKKENAPSLYFQEPTISETVPFDYFILDDNINFVFTSNKKEETYNKIFDIDKIMGGKNILIDVYENFVYSNTIISEQIKSIPINKNTHYKFDIYYKYSNGLLNGPKETLEFIYN